MRTVLFLFCLFCVLLYATKPSVDDFYTELGERRARWDYLQKNQSSALRGMPAARRLPASSNPLDQMVVQLSAEAVMSTTYVKDYLLLQLFTTEYPTPTLQNDQRIYTIGVLGAFFSFRH